MRKRKCLGFFVLVLVLVLSMFGNVFASSNGGWTCIEESNSDYSVGNTVNKVTYTSISADGYHSESCTFESNFEVEEGDLLSVAFGAYFDGNSDKFDGSASYCIAQIIAENGDVIARVKFELNGNYLSEYGVDSAYVTEETAGKIRFNIFMENTGTFDVSSELDELVVERNGIEI